MWDSHLLVNDVSGKRSNEGCNTTMDKPSAEQQVCGDMACCKRKTGPTLLVLLGLMASSLDVRQNMDELQNSLQIKMLDFLPCLTKA